MKPAATDAHKGKAVEIIRHALGDWWGRDQLIYTDDFFRLRNGIADAIAEAEQVRPDHEDKS